jgi:hypothetical protein
MLMPIFNNISDILWWSVLLKIPEYLAKTTDLQQFTDKLNAPHHEWDSNSQLL